MSLETMYSCGFTYMWNANKITFLNSILHHIFTLGENKN